MVSWGKVVALGLRGLWHKTAAINGGVWGECSWGYGVSGGFGGRSRRRRRWGDGAVFYFFFVVLAFINYKSPLGFILTFQHFQY